MRVEVHARLADKKFHYPVPSPVCRRSWPCRSRPSKNITLDKNIHQTRWRRRHCQPTSLPPPTTIEMDLRRHPLPLEHPTKGRLLNRTLPKKSLESRQLQKLPYTNISWRITTSGTTIEEDLRELYWVRAGDLYLSSSVDGLARRKGGRDHFLKRLGGHWGLHSLHQLLGTEIYQATEQDCQQD